jgi:membrane dipeptidase
MVELLDLHADYILAHLKSAEKYGVKVALTSVYTTKLKDPMREIKYTRQIIDEHKTGVELRLHIEDAWFVDENNIDELIGYKPFSVGITWNGNNKLAGGAHGDGELTELGKLVVKKLVANGVVIDLAHLNRKSFYQVAEMLKGQRLLCTHTCFDEVHPHNRNLDRKQIQTIVDSDGIVGLTFVGKFLTSDRRVTMEDVYKHIEYFIKNFGEDNLAIGTDFLGAPKFPRGLNKYKDMYRLKKFLLGKGLSEATIHKIFYANAYSRL